MLVEGPRAVTTAQRAGARMRFAVASRGGSDVRALEEAGVEVVTVTSGELEALADTQSPQGLLAVAEEPVHELESLGPELAGPGSLRLLVLDGVQDPGNAGSLVRAAAGLGIDGVVALEGTVDPWNPKAVRASAGEGFRVPIVRVSWDVFSRWIAGADLPLLVAAADGDDVRLLLRPGPDPSLLPPRDAGWALLVGSEAAGARSEARRAAAAVLALPLARHVESLNAAMAGSILLWALGPGRDHPRT